ncbi:MAG: diacylglycerol kinase family protein [Novosphingobium sp.]|nr:diacylglycerol kinase family protein [Novosphingobium sp.]
MERTTLDLQRQVATATPDEPPVNRTGEASALASLPRVGIIRNARSHRNKGAECDYLNDPNVISAAPQTKPELAVALARFAREKIGLLIIDGGDGTIRDVLTRAAPVFRDKWPPIIVLPMGKTNALAYNLGLPHNWSLNDALNTALRGRAVVRRPMIIERLDTPQRDRVGFLLGAGVFNAAIEAGQTAHRAGAFESLAVGITSAFGVMQAMVGFGSSPWRSSFSMRLRTGEALEEIPHYAHGTPDSRYLVAISTLTHFPFGLRPFPKVLEENKLNHIVYDAPLRRAAAMFPPLMLGYDPAFLGKIGIHRGATSQMMLEFGDSFILDGETYPGGNYRVRLGPELHFIAP